MLKPDPGIVAREDAEGVLLFNPDNGGVSRLNSSGYFIWRCLAAGMDRAGILAELRKACGAPDSAAQVLDSFLAGLAAGHFIEGYAGPAAPVAAIRREEPENRALYEMNSMFRVFSPGDALVLKAVPFAEIAPGDVIAFHPDRPRASGVVHRVIARDAESLRTMGDNNPRPDVRSVTAMEMPRLVVAKISPDNVRHEISRGNAGLRQFRRNRIRRAFRLFAGAVFRPLLPWMFWRIELGRPARKGKTIQYYYRRRLIAEGTGNAVRFTSPWYQFRFRVPDAVSGEKE